MSLLRELYKLKEQDVTFKRGAMEPTPDDDGSQDSLDGDVPADLGDDSTDIGDPDGSGDPDMDMGDSDGSGDPDAMDDEGSDIVEFEMPALIKALEWAHAEAADEEAIHAFAEEVLSCCDGGPVTLDAVESAIGTAGGGEGESDALDSLDDSGEDLGGDAGLDDPEGLGGDDVGGTDELDPELDSGSDDHMPPR